MIRLTLPLLLISTILCAHLHAETDGAKAPAPAKSFAFAPPGNIKAGAYDVKTAKKIRFRSCYNDPKECPVQSGADMTTLTEYTVTVAPANKKQKQVLELTYERLQESRSSSVTRGKGVPKKEEESFDSRHPKQAKGMECIEKRMSVMGKKARWTLRKGALVKSDGFKQLRKKEEFPTFGAADYEAEMAAYDDAKRANQLIGLGEVLFPQYTRALLPTKPMKVGDTWKRKVDISLWFGPSTNEVSIPAKATCTLSKVKGTVATVTFVLRIPPCTYTYHGRTFTVTGKGQGKGSLQYDFATQLIITEQVAFTVVDVLHEEDGDLPTGPVTQQFQRTLTITPKKTKAKAKAAPAKKPAN